jgi:hypothetical protein
MRARVRTATRLHRKANWRVLLFPLLLHVWPLLLLMSQKALTPLGLLLASAGGTRQFRRDMLVATAMVGIGALTLLLQRPNEYAVAHYVGYALFVLSVPLINAAALQDRARLIQGLALLSLFNSLMAFVVYGLAIDLSAFRGLNRIVGDDDETHRVYYETASLLAVFSVQFIRGKVLRWLCVAIVAAYALLLARSVFVILLFLLNRYLHRAVHGTLLQRMATIAIIVVVAIVGPIITLLLRSDLELSLGIKLLQFNEILEDPSPAFTGSGWGYVIDAIVNSPDQEYQVEMQLPMLMRQIGWGGVLAYVAGMFLLIRSVSANLGCAVLRWLTYLAIGFNNPWLLIPSWYMTTCLMYLQLDRKKP